MYNRNDGSEIYALQNQFTTYLAIALHRTKLRFLHKRDELYREIPLEENELPRSDDSDPLLIAIHTFKNELLCQVLKKIKKRERYILLAHVIEEKTFAELSNELGISYKTVASTYYRLLVKLRRMLGGDYNDEF